MATLKDNLYSVEFTSGSVNVIQTGATKVLHVYVKVASTDVWLRHSAISSGDKLTTLNMPAGLFVKVESKADFTLTQVETTDSSKVSGLKAEVVSALPATGDADKIYLVAEESSSSENKYKEYFYLEGEQRFELLGIKELDVTNKQDVIDDLETIRSGAALGATSIQSLDGYATEAWVESKNYLTEHQDISGKQDVIPELADIKIGASLGATAVQPEEGKGLFSGSYNDLTDKPNIPSIDGLETSEHAAATYQPKGEYLTEHQSLDSYALKSEIPSLDGYATQSWVEEKGYLTEHQSLTDYALKSDIPSTEGLDLSADIAALLEEISKLKDRISDLESKHSIVFTTDAESITSLTSEEASETNLKVDGTEAVEALSTTNSSASNVYKTLTVSE